MDSVEAQGLLFQKGDGMGFAFFVIGMVVGILILDKATGRDTFADIRKMLGFKNSR